MPPHESEANAVICLQPKKFGYLRIEKNCAQLLSGKRFTPRRAAPLGA